VVLELAKVRKVEFLFLSRSASSSSPFSFSFFL